jgi:hypothetical protein
LRSLTYKIGGLRPHFGHHGPDRPLLPRAIGTKEGPSCTRRTFYWRRSNDQRFRARLVTGYAVCWLEAGGGERLNLSGTGHLGPPARSGGLRFATTLPKMTLCIRYPQCDGKCS